MSFDFFGIRFREKRIRIGSKTYKISVKKQLFGVVFAIIICTVTGFVINNKDTMVESDSNTPTPTTEPIIETATAPIISSPSDITGTSAENFIIIHVSGAVISPGIVSVTQGARIADIIDAAGGFSEDCDLSEINLAAYAVDGMKIHIPHLGETPSLILPNVIAPSPTPVFSSLPSYQDASRTGPYEKININTATLPQLTQLNGIGESIAQKIIAYREEHGFFTKIEDILLVSGIGTNKYNAIKDYICV
ncbi:MAG: ComEA family DNA-binding protein [Ruminococcaceae bacterium]|nr:ComEA family DNA-binding protein [Oscillospiraceae bacterium]